MSSPESAPVAVREKMRSRFHGSHDLIHRLFVCISGAPLGPRVGMGSRVHGGWASFRQWLARCRSLPRKVGVRALPRGSLTTSLPCRKPREEPSQEVGVVRPQVLLSVGVGAQAGPGGPRHPPVRSCSI